MRSSEVVWSICFSPRDDLTVQTLRRNRRPSHLTPTVVISSIHFRQPASPSPEPTPNSAPFRRFRRASPASPVRLRSRRVCIGIAILYPASPSGPLDGTTLGPRAKGPPTTTATATHAPPLPLDDWESHHGSCWDDASSAAHTTDPPRAGLSTPADHAATSLAPPGGIA